MTLKQLVPAFVATAALLTPSSIEAFRVDPRHLEKGALAALLAEEDIEDHVQQASFPEPTKDILPEPTKDILPEPTKDLPEPTKDIIVPPKPPTGKEGLCSIHGDPHLLTFDGQRWDPLHAVGHYWLVQTEQDDLAIQATYGKCGTKNGGGWQRLLYQGIPRTCMTGVAVYGRHLPEILIVQTPCDWDWDNSKCLNDDKKPRITWGGARVDSVDTGDVTVQVKGNTVEASLPMVGVKLKLAMGGVFQKGKGATYMNAQIRMKKDSFGMQCGHCGNFDGNGKNDKLYDKVGELMDTKLGGLCDPNVPCEKRLIPGDAACAENEPGSEINAEDCPEDIRVQAEKLCQERRDEIADNPKISWTLNPEFMKECIEDACVDKAFIDEDFAEEEDEDATEVELKKG
mmetsp:Transcript_68440/g.143033  ORF Transcript_68440/g.143033 Transcript_68440/m.143033 type:complete len:400 (-) Transcript_68440:162-1361(-)